MYDDGEDWIGAGHDTGIDGCHDQLEDGNDGCIGPDDDVIYDIDTNPDPNKDNYNIDPNNDNNTFENNGYWDYLDYGIDDDDDLEQEHFDEVNNHANFVHDLYCTDRFTEEEAVKLMDLYNYLNTMAYEYY